MAVTKSVKEIYALAVCFAAAMVGIASGAACIQATIRIVSPHLMVSEYEYGRSLSDDAFLASWPANGTPVPDAAAVPRLREERFANALRMEQQRGVRNLVEQIGYVVLAAVIFGVHWWLARREWASAAGTPSAG